MLRLHVVPADGPPFDHALDAESLTIGRSSNCGLILADRFLSRTHARILREGESFMVEDLGSRNGTLLNGQPIEKAGPLRPGDVIRLSGSVITIGPADGAAVPAGAQPGTQAQSLYRSAAELLKPGVPPENQGSTGVDMVRRLAERIRLMSDVHHDLGKSIDTPELLELILDRVFQHFRPEEGAIFLRRPDGELYRAASRNVPGVSDEHFYSRTLIHEVTEKGLAALVLDAQTDERFARSGSIMASGVRSLIAAPLFDSLGSFGMIVLSSRMHVRQFGEEDMELLAALASAAALKLRNVALVEEAAERRRLEGELALARQIQLALLPAHLPEVPGYQLAAGNVPSRHVSGDYYKVVTRKAGQECALMVADVSGKGIAASLLTAAIEALSSGPIEDGLPPAEIFVRVSRLLHQRTPPERFATAFLAVLERGTGRVRYANAGHNPALLVRAAGAMEALRATGLPLGILPAAFYETGECSLAPGDTLIIYSDGITEAQNPDGEDYSLNRLSDLCRRHRGAELAELQQTIERDLESFACGVPFQDDRTIVLARRI
jgi:sigma-B regulation protein RsbU (phosphoserine phosphatase)